MKRLIACVLAFAMMLCMVACARQEEIAPVTEATTPAPEPIAPAQKVIHVLVPEKAEGWMAKTAAVAGAAAEAIKAEGKYDVVVTGYADEKAQREILESLAAQSTKDGSMGVVLMPESVDMEDVLAKLLEANVSYALADTIPAGAANASVTNISYDQRAIGAAAAAWLVQNGLTEDQRVVIVQGFSEQEVLRTEGFQMYLQGKLEHEGAKIETPWESLNSLVYSEMQGETQESAEAYFKSYMGDSDHADTKFFVVWDDAYGMGILKMLEGENIDEDIKEEFLEGKPVIVSCGGSQVLLDVIKTSEEISVQTIVYSTDVLKIALESMVTWFDGTVIPQNSVLPIVWATAENAGQYQGY